MHTCVHIIHPNLDLVTTAYIYTLFVVDAFLCYCLIRFTLSKIAICAYFNLMCANILVVVQFSVTFMFLKTINVVVEFGYQNKAKTQIHSNRDP